MKNIAFFLACCALLANCTTPQNNPCDCITTSPLILFSAPSDWGINIDGSSGSAELVSCCHSHLKLIISVKGLKKNSVYKICFNGYSGKPGNDILGKLGEKIGAEGVLNIGEYQTNDTGAFKGEINIELPPHSYYAKLFVKDFPSWKIVLYKDEISFRINK